MTYVELLLASDCHQNVTEHSTTSGHRATQKVLTCIRTHR